ncbi:porin family protein [Rufibacter roseus]|uniref:Porin family protein n=1 Tax=Rufibacter roseus TaxID=1567108 RepID=A0ABW2DHJ3_9BACT|nr:porin family protein [Rufibacter roseus]
MKKLLFFVATLFTVSLAQAQDGIKLGLKAGVNIASMAGDDADDITNKFGFHIGGFADYGISEMVSIRPELLYSTKGATSEENDDASFNLNYIDVPVLARIKADKLFFEFGPTFSFLVKAEVSDGDVSINVKDATRGFDFGYAAGLGYQFTEQIGLGLRYNGGLTNIFEEEDGESLAEVRNSVFQVSLSYSFGR